MKLMNVTMVVLVRQANGTLVAGRVIENPLVATSHGLPVFGPLARRLMSVGEIAAKLGVSRNKAAEARRQTPLAFAVPFNYGEGNQAA
jgi:hypothetical protein